MNRLTRRRKLLIGGCVFAAVVLGLACTGTTPAQAASCEVSMQASRRSDAIQFIRLDLDRI